MVDNADLARLIERSTDALGDGLHETAIARLHLIRASSPTAPLHVVHEPAVCFVVQGAKKAVMGDQVIRYGGGCFLVVSVDVPVVGQIITASEAEPYLCLRIGLDAPLLAGLMLDAGVKAEGGAVRRSAWARRRRTCSTPCAGWCACWRAPPTSRCWPHWSSARSSTAC